MPDDKPGPITIQVDPALFQQFVEDCERIVGAAEAVASVARVLTAAKDGKVVTSEHVQAAAEVAEPATPRVWDTRAAALENYDGEQLVALRKDHLSVDHDVTDCYICAIVDRRLGYREPT